MAPADLTTAPPADTPTRRPRTANTAAVLAITYAALLAATALAAGVSLLPNYIEPQLQLYPHRTPTIEAALETWIHNIRVAGWPLLFAAVGTYRVRGRRRLGDSLLAIFIASNTALVGAAIAVGGSRIAPYLPHLPVEWAALATATAGWLLASRRALSRRALATLAAAFVALLAIAAALETYAVPHVL